VDQDILDKILNALKRNPEGLTITDISKVFYEHNDRFQIPGSA